MIGADQEVAHLKDLEVGLETLEEDSDLAVAFRTPSLMDAGAAARRAILGRSARNSLRSRKRTEARCLPITKGRMKKL